MRTIKFRGKCTPDSRFAGEWVDGGCVQCEESDDVLIISATKDNCTMTCHVIHETVGQFTGLFDIDETEIYEGDIVDCDYILYDPWNNEEEILEPIRCVVEYSDSGFILREGEELSQFFTDATNIKVIGNIHDNPELLKN